MTQTLARRENTTPTTFSGTSRNAEAITNLLQEASEKYHLVSPATACGRLPEGTGVALSTVMVDANIENGEVYPVGGGKLGLGKVSLDRIAAAAGISWDATQSRRMDDGRDPYYCHYKAVGAYRSFDGTEVQIQGEKEMDMRDGSPQIEALQARIRDKSKNADAQIREMRLHILAHAESKARLRAIRSMGIRSSYLPKELEKPFVVARIMWTGETNDPELRREFARMQAMAFMGGTRALYGVPLSAPGLPPASVAHCAPPVGSVPIEDDDQPLALPPRRADPTPERKSEPRQTPPQSGGSDDAGPCVEFGRKQGTPLRELSDDDLNWYIDAAHTSLDDPKKAKWRPTEEKRLAQYEAEMDRRYPNEGATAGDDLPT